MCLSAVIIVKNAEHTLEKTLQSLSLFKEILIYDTGSTDKSKTIALTFANVRWIDGYFDQFGATKNRAVASARYDWIFSLDADESVDAQLAQSMLTFPFDDPKNVGEILRENWFYGQAVTVGGWGNDRLIRLFHRRYHQFSNRCVHEAVVIDKNTHVIALSGRLQHQAVTDLAQLITKIDRYSALSAQIVPKKPFFIIVLKTFYAFIRSYFFQCGFLAGWRGFTIAVYEANNVYFKYLRAKIKS